MALGIFSRRLKKTLRPCFVLLLAGSLLSVVPEADARPKRSKRSKSEKRAAAPKRDVNHGGKPAQQKLLSDYPTRVKEFRHMVAEMFDVSDPGKLLEGTLTSRSFHLTFMGKAAYSSQRAEFAQGIWQDVTDLRGQSPTLRFLDGDPQNGREWTSRFGHLRSQSHELHVGVDVDDKNKSGNLRARFAKRQSWGRSADVLVLFDLHDESLAGLAEALLGEKRPIIGILDTAESRANLAMVREVVQDALGDRLVIAPTPRELQAGLRRAMAKKTGGTTALPSLSSTPSPQTRAAENAVRVLPKLPAKPLPAPAPPKPPRPRPKEMLRGEFFPIGDYPERIAIFGQGSSLGVDGAVTYKAEELGRLVGESQIPLITGGGNGVPLAAAKRAKKAGAQLWAVTPAGSVDSYVAEGPERAEIFDLVLPTGMGGGSGSAQRSAPLVELANIALTVAGGPGTLAEVIAAMYRPGVVGMLDKTGGVADQGVRLREMLDPPDDVATVIADSPQELFDLSRAALRGLHERGMNTSRPPRFRPSVRKEMSIEGGFGKKKFTFLVEDPRTNAADLEKISELADLSMNKDSDWSRYALLPDRDGAASQAVLGAAARHERTSIRISSQSGDSDETGRLRRIFLGYGDGVGEFAAQREIIESADVIFVTSAHFRNMAGLSQALRKKGSGQIIAILELESSKSNQIMDLLRGLGVSSDKVLHDADPKALMAKVADRLAPKSFMKKDFGKTTSSGKNTSSGKDGADRPVGWVSPYSSGKANSSQSSSAPSRAPSPAAKEDREWNYEGFL